MEHCSSVLQRYDCDGCLLKQMPVSTDVVKCCLKMHPTCCLLTDSSSQSGFQEGRAGIRPTDLAHFVTYPTVYTFQVEVICA